MNEEPDSHEGGKEEAREDFADTVLGKLLETRAGILFLLGGRVADAASTVYFVDKLGINKEQNQLLRNLMDQYGTVEGNAIHLAGAMAIAIPTAFALNKLFKKMGLKKLEAGNMIIYLLYGAESYAVAIHNLIFTHLQ